MYSDFVCCCFGDFSAVEVNMLQGLGRNQRGSPTLAKITPKTFSFGTVVVKWEQCSFLALETHLLTVMIDFQLSPL